MTLPGEEAAVRQMLKDAETYGYGNFIAHLKREWARLLMVQYGLDAAAATVGADTDAYPFGFNELPKRGAARGG